MNQKIEKLEREQSKYSVDKRMRLITSYVLGYNSNTSNLFKDLGSKKLDILCHKISQELFNNKPIWNKTNKNIFICTKISRTGGHTRQLIEFIKKSNSKSLIVLTGIFGPSDIDYFIQNTEKKFVDIINLNGNYDDKAIELNSIIFKEKPGKIFIFSDPADTIPIVALADIPHNAIYFYHHANIYLSLGLYIDNFVHIDFYPNGFYNCRNKLKIENIYIPLSYDNKNFKPQISSKLDYLNTCTVANSNKISIPYIYSYSDVIIELLKNKIKHTHIGKLPIFSIIKIRFYMVMNRVPYKNLSVYNNVTSLKDYLKNNDIDFYLNSFPIGGACTLIEFISLGIPVLFHNNKKLNLANCIDLGYEDCLKWNTVEELKSIIKNISKSDYNYHSNKSYETFKKNYNGERLSDFMNSDKKIILDNIDYRIGEYSVSPTGSNTIYKFLYNIFLFFKNKIKIILNSR